MTATLAFSLVSKWYGNVLGVSQVNLEIRPGVLGLLGVNGAGKSTLMKMAAGLLRPSLGTVKVLGSNPRTEPEVRKHIGYCPEIDRFYESMRVEAWIRGMARYFGYSGQAAKKITDEVLHKVGMTENRRKKLSECSKGMRQRTKLARAMLGQPGLYLLDEPLTGLDPIGRHDIVTLVQELGSQGNAVIVSSHVLEEVEQMTDQLVLIHQGRLMARGSISEIRDQIQDQPRKMAIGCTQPRRLGRELLALPSVEGIEVEEQGLKVRVLEAGAFFQALTKLGADSGLGVHSVVPLDEGLDAVFGYLVNQ
jgi:ABC-2 type transport system ATP-binding protein